MLVIRLRRKGKKNQPFFRVIVVDKRKTAKGGHAVEILGNVDPLTKKRNFKKDRILYWISKGAKPSPTVHNLLVSEKIIEAKKIDASKKPKKSAEPKSAAVSAVEAKPAESAQPASASAEATADKPAEQPKPEEKLVAAPEEKKDLPATAEEAKPEVAVTNQETPKA